MQILIEHKSDCNHYLLFNFFGKFPILGRTLSRIFGRNFNKAFNKNLNNLFSRNFSKISVLYEYTADNPVGLLLFRFPVFN